MINSKKDPNHDDHDTKNKGNQKRIRRITRRKAARRITIIVKKMVIGNK